MNIPIDRRDDYLRKAMAALVISAIGWLFYTTSECSKEIHRIESEMEELDRQQKANWDQGDKNEEQIYQLGKDIAVLLDRDKRP